ncbi:MAG: DJ-1/PfpI family protein [Bacteroidota bacterium]
MKNSLLFFLLLVSSLVKAQIKDTLNIALFVYDGVELLDFTGPGEVFAASSYYTNLYHFNVYTVAKEEQLTSQDFLSITPNYNLDNAPKSDVLILPGGNAGSVFNDRTVQSWIKDEIENATNVLTVCSGVYFLEKPGKLEGIKVTSHHKIIPFLRETLDAENVIDDVKYVDSGKIVTSAGVSSGIEGALLMVSKIAGYEVANRTARYMEYPQWDISNGRITYDLIKNADALLEDKEEPFVFGTFDLAGYKALSENDKERAHNFFYQNSLYFPKSATAYYGLAKAMSSTIDWVPPTYEDYLDVLRNDGAEKGRKIYDKAKKIFPDWLLFTQKDIKVRGSNLLNEENIQAAELVFSMGVDSYPNDLELHIQLIEAQIRLKKSKKAKESISMALVHFPKNEQLLSLEQILNSK